MSRAGESGLEKDLLPPLGEDLDFLGLIWGVDHALHRASKSMETIVGVTGPQRLVIRIVGRFPGIPAGHLARLLRVHPSTLTGVLKRLQGRGLLRRRSDPRDGRRRLLGLTDKGRIFDVETPGTIEAAIRRVLDVTPQDRLQAAREVLNSIAAALGERDSGGARTALSENGLRWH
ncbi:MAG: MarR family winged helix-turn-helix transcriptional regulator [Thermoanaerobaculia bacterium]